MGLETPREEYVGLNGIAGIVGVNATVEYLAGNIELFMERQVMLTKTTVRMQACAFLV